MRFFEYMRQRMRSHPKQYYKFATQSRRAKQENGEIPASSRLPALGITDIKEGRPEDTRKIGCSVETIEIISMCAYSSSVFTLS